MEAEQEYKFAGETDLYNIQQYVNGVLRMYYLLEFTKDATMVDFDNFDGMYANGLDVLGMEVEQLGQELGLLDHYEDCLNYVNEEKWHELYKKMPINFQINL